LALFVLPPSVSGKMRKIRALFATPKIPLLLAVLAASLPAFAAPAALPPPVIDNDRVTVWDITMNPGDSAPMTPSDMDRVVMYVEDGAIGNSNATGSDIYFARKFGDARFLPKGAAANDKLLIARPAHEIVVALKDRPEPRAPNPTSYPLAFPRPGAVKVLENDRAIIWRYSWTPGKPTAMHFHDKDVVVAYRYDGTLKATMPDGSVTENPYKQGDIRFNKANRSHSELLTTKRQSAVILELK
jgi:hypothetical protein